MNKTVGNRKGEREVQHRNFTQVLVDCPVYECPENLPAYSK